jgi:hypothetical protein
MDRLPLQFLMLVFAGWANRHQQEMIEYLQEENRFLRAQLGGKRLSLPRIWSGPSLLRISWIWPKLPRR